MTIGERIKLLRTQNNLTQEELANYAKTTKQTIHKYETGIITNIPAIKIKAISEKLCTTPAYLMGWEGKQESSYSFKRCLLCRKTHGKNRNFLFLVLRRFLHCLHTVIEQPK